MARQSSKKMYFALKIIHSFLPVAFQLPGDPAWTTVFFPAGSLLLAKWPSLGHTSHPLQILTALSPSLIGKMAVSNVLSADAISTPVFSPVIWQYLTRLMIWSHDILFPITVNLPANNSLTCGIWCRKHVAAFALLVYYSWSAKIYLSHVNYSFDMTVYVRKNFKNYFQWNDFFV